jgi:hypothetical protein
MPWTAGGGKAQYECGLELPPCMELFLWRPGEHSAYQLVFGCLVSTEAIRVRLCRKKNLNLSVELCTKCVVFSWRRNHS